MTRSGSRWFRVVPGVMFLLAVGLGCSSTSSQGSGSGGSTGSSGSSGTGGRTGSAGATGDAGGYTRVAVCGSRGRATADATSYDGYEERFMIDDSGLGVDICVVRWDLKRVGAAPAGCTVCSWTHLVEYSNPTVITDTGGVCANSDLHLDAAAIAAVVGTRASIGFASMLGGAHGSARMKYFDTTQMWDVFGNATWDTSTNSFRYDYRDGFCNY